MNSKIAALLLLACAPACGAETTTGGKTNWLAGDAAASAKPGPRPSNADAGETDASTGTGATSTLSAAAGASDLPLANTHSGDAMAVLSSTPSSAPASGTTAASNAEVNPLDAGAPAGPDAAAPDGSLPPVEDPGLEMCMPDIFEPNGQNPPPQPEECTGIGETLVQNHDAALEGPVLDVPLLVGTWGVGSGVSHVELVLDGDGKGTLRFGQASDYPTPSATDETFLSRVGDRAAAIIGAELRPHAGYAYTVVADAGQGSEMSFHILTVEAWQPWCELQPPVASPFAPNCYACVEVAERYSFFPAFDCGEEQAGCYASDREADETKRLHCGRLGLCAAPYSSACVCTAETCFANVAIPAQGNRYSYELQLDPLDSSILRLRGLSELQEPTTHYLTKVVAD